jgi:hypothetical protein
MSDLSPRLDPEHLAVVRYPPGWTSPDVPAGHFVAVVSGEHEVTVVCPESLVETDAWSADAVQVDIGWQRVTFPGPLPWEQVGFLADVAARLADAQIPFTSMSGFTTDHVLIRAAQADLAVDVLSGGEPPQQRPGTNP